MSEEPTMGLTSVVGPTTQQRCTKIHDILKELCPGPEGALGTKTGSLPLDVHFFALNADCVSPPTCCPVGL